MKKIGFFALVFMTMAVSAAAQEKKDDFSAFMKEELASFNKFMDDANRDFINFLRDPWKEFEADKPVVKRTKPEPVKPVVYDEKTAPKDEKPVRLTIEEILDLSTTEGKQNPVVKIKDVDDIQFDKPAVIVKKKKKPTVVVVEDKKADKPVVEPEGGKQEPVIVPQEEPLQVPEEEPVSADVEPTNSGTTPARNTPLYDGGIGRSKIVYMGQVFYLPDELKGKCRLNGVKENDVADAYEAMYGADYKPLLTECKQIASNMQLNDWGVFTLLRTVANAFCSNENESVVMQQFLLNEMGYKAKMARKANANKMLLFVAADCTIYGYPVLKLGGVTYYTVNSNEPCAFYMCEKDAPNARNDLQMQLKHSPVFQGKTVRTTHQAKGNAAKVTVDVPEELMAFYKNYPQCDYSVYFKASVNKGVATALLSSLSPFIQGKSEVEAANILINFVQTAFQYATDDEQFGYEKPFFVEELFYYPYSDCEDRSMLYSYLVRNLLGLDVVLLDYPNHIATAVRFNGDVVGDYLMVNGQKYIVCDPTYIGASIGMTMPAFKKVAAKVLKY